LLSKKEIKMDNNEENVYSGNLKEDYKDALKNLINLAEESLEAQDFDSAKVFLQGAKKLIELYDLVDILSDWYPRGVSDEIPLDELDEINLIEDQKRLKKGLRTREEQFVMPILEAIIELGGKAKVKDVLELVYYKMEDILNSYDYEPLPSNPKQQRWENTAQWARNMMVNKGLLAKNTPKGIWEITEKGKKFYEEKINNL